MIKTDFPNIKLLKRKSNAVYLISMNGVALDRQQFKEKMNGFLSTIKDKKQKIILFLDVHYYGLISIVKRTLEDLWRNYLICGIGEIFGYQIKNDKFLVYSLVINLLKGNKIVLAEREVMLTNYQDIIDLIESDRLFHITNKEVFFGHRIQLSKLVQIIKGFLSTTYGFVVIKGKSKNKLAVQSLDPNLSRESRNSLIGRIKDNISFIRTRKTNINIKVRKSSEKHFFGGSPAKLEVINTKYGIFLRKTVIDRGYEGNGIPKLRNEVEFIKRIRQNYPRFGDFYPKIYGEQESAERLFYEMEYFPESPNVADGIANGVILPNDFFISLDNLLGVVLEDVIKPTAKFLTEQQSLNRLDALYLQRARDRMLKLRDNPYGFDFPVGADFSINSLFSKKKLIINGKEFLSPLLILERLDAKFGDILKPRIESICFHGDFTLSNVIYIKNRKLLKLVDPRGYYGYWDPIYDFGKIKFTLSGFRKLVIKEFDLSVANNGLNNIFLVKFNGSSKGIKNLSKINSLYIKHLGKSKYFEYIKEKEPFWEERILFGEAIHYFSDIPFRLYTDKSSKIPLGCFLIGTQLLNEFYSKLVKKYN